jgi:2-dehydro-3-deoxyphosphogluconate aldolase/(4S)-4-hydroxy-2-oxoglutarate aldolase
MEMTITEAIDKHKIIAIIRGVAADKLIPLADALYKGGIRLLEITYSADGSVSDEETASSIKALASNFEGRMYIGAGTVLTEEQVALTAQAGGKFIISPNVDKDVITATVKHGLVSMPGALTPSDICQAHKYGADFVKLFPVSDLGAGYVKAVKAPLSHIKFLAVGGINEINACEYLKAGAVGIGVGSNIADKNLIKASNFEAIKALSEKYVLAVK